MDPADRDFITRTPAIALTILTGFLGAGKTTLLNRILNGDHGLRVAVLVNDFGAINIDAELVVGVESNVVSLANGCICCTIRDDLVAAVLETIGRPERPEHILLEASGVAEPSSLAMTFDSPALREHIRLDGVLCVVDAEQVFAAPDTMQLKLFQMACADMIILNKVDLVGPARVAQITAWLDRHFHRYRLVETVRGDVPLPVLLGTSDCAPDRRDRFDSHYVQVERASDHSQTFGTWSYETVQPLSLEALRSAAAKLPGGIYRAKGVIHAADAPERRAVLQVVGRRVDLALADAWGERTPRTRIVAIGAVEATRADAFRAAFAQCIAPAPWAI